MNIDRRNFLKSIGLIPVSLLLLKHNHVSANELKVNGPHHLVTAIGNDVIITNLLTHEEKTYHTNTKGHDFYQHPIQKNLLYIVSKWEKNFSILNLDTGKEHGMVSSLSEGFLFYGHIAISNDGSKFYSPQIHPEKNIGTLVVYDTRTLKPIEQIADIIGGTHDVQFLSDQKTLVVTSDGVKNKTERVAPSALLIIDTETKKQINKYYIENAYQKVGHLRILDHDEIVVLTSPLDIPIEGKVEKHGLIYSNRADTHEAKLYEWKIKSAIKEKLNFELLSSSFNSSKKQLLVTNPAGNLILYFDTLNRQLIKTEPSANTGVVTFNNNFKTIKTNAHAKIIDLA